MRVSPPTRVTETYSHVHSTTLKMLPNLALKEIK